MPTAGPPPLQPPVRPIVVQRSYREAPPYTAGGRRTVRLEAHPGGHLSAPCRGRVWFAGAVAGSAPVLTIDCAGPALRVTVGRLAPRQQSGDEVAQGAVIGHALGGHVGLSVRDASGRYLDPLPLLASGAGARPPAVVPRRSPTERPWRPAPEVKGLRTLAASPHAAATATAGPDPVLGIAGSVAGAGTLAWWASRRHARRRRPVATGSALPVAEPR